MTLADTRQAAAAAASATFHTAWARVRPRAAAMRLARWSRTAQAKTAGVPIGPGERVLTLDLGPAGALAAATTAAVYFGGEREPGRTWWRVGWEEVTSVGWDNRRSVLTFTGAGPGGMWRKEVALDRRSTVPALLASRMVRHNDQVCAVVMARLQPRSGKVIWVTLLNQTGPPTRSGDPGQGRSSHRRPPSRNRHPRPVATCRCGRKSAEGLWEGAPIVPSAYSSAGRARRMRSRAHVV